MLQANPAADAQRGQGDPAVHRAESYAGYHALSQGAGFLNARGAVELARFFAGTGDRSDPSTAGWSRQIIWGNQRVTGGVLTPTANAWATERGLGRRDACRAGRPSRGASCARRDDCEQPADGRTVGERAAAGPDCADSRSTSSGVRPAAAPTARAGLVAGRRRHRVLGDSDEDTVVWGTTDATTTWSCGAPPTRRGHRRVGHIGDRRRGLGHCGETVLRRRELADMQTSMFTWLGRIPASASRAAARGRGLAAERTGVERAAARRAALRRRRHRRRRRC